eukprot:jgi/Ulvmu1/2286/UM013_0133.1
MSALGLGEYAAEEESSDEESDQHISPRDQASDLKEKGQLNEAPEDVTGHAGVPGGVALADVAVRIQGPDSAADGATPERTQGLALQGTPQQGQPAAVDADDTAPLKRFSVPGVPDAPAEPCEEKWQQRVSWVLQQQSRMGKKMIRELQGNRTYRNPRFMEKVIKDAGVAQYGTCCPKDTWDPDSLPSSDFWKSLKRTLEEKRLKRARQPAAQKPTAVHKSGVHPGSMSASAAAGARIAANMTSKRSKWDQGTRDR